MVRDLAPHEISEHACSHLQTVIESLRDRHGISPIRAELDIKSVILTVEYDARLTAAMLAEAAVAFASISDLTFDERGFSCRTDWQSAAIPVAEAPPPRGVFGRFLAWLRS
jgi:hypothetical protein